MEGERNSLQTERNTDRIFFICSLLTPNYDISPQSIDSKLSYLFQLFACLPPPPPNIQLYFICFLVPSIPFVMWVPVKWFSSCAIIRLSGYEGLQINATMPVIGLYQINKNKLQQTYRCHGKRRSDLDKLGVVLLLLLSHRCCHLMVPAHGHHILDLAGRVDVLLCGSWRCQVCDGATKFGTALLDCIVR